MNMVRECEMLDRLEDARAEVATYERRVWWLSFAVVTSLGLLLVAFWAGAVTEWQNLPAALGIFAGTSFFAASSGLCGYVFTIGSDRDGFTSYDKRKLSPRTRIRNIEREYRDSYL